MLTRSWAAFATLRFRSKRTAPPGKTKPRPHKLAQGSFQRQAARSLQGRHFVGEGTWPNGLQTWK